MKCIRTRFIPATDTRGSRISADDGDGNKITMSWDHALSTTGNHGAAANALCEKMSWTGEMTMGWHKNYGYWVFV